MGIVVDTSAIITLERRRTDPSAIDSTLLAEGIYIPAIVWAELFVGVQLAPTVTLALDRRQWLDGLRSSATSLPFTPEVGEVWAKQFAALRRRGRMIPANDLAIISTALYHGFKILVGPKDEAHFREVAPEIVITL